MTGVVCLHLGTHLEVLEDAVGKVLVIGSWVLNTGRYVSVKFSLIVVQRERTNLQMP